MNNGHDKKFRELLGAYYGGAAVKRKQKKQKPSMPVTFSKIFDNGDNLVQKTTEPPFEEYVVMQSSVTTPVGEVFEEYVVQASLPEAEAFEEYVVGSSAQNGNTSGMYAASASFSEPDVSSAEEYRMDMMESLSTGSDAPLQEPAMPADSIPQIGAGYDSPPAGSNPPLPSKDVSEAASREKDFEEDFQAILSGKKVFDPVTKKTVDKEQLGRQQSVPPPTVPAPAEFSNGHAIFDEIAKKMQYATAYDLGVVELDKRFSDFDKVSELQKLANAAKAKRSSALTEAVIEKAASIKPDINTADFINDLDAIRRGSRGETIVARSVSLDASTAPVLPDIHSTEWPLRPANLRPLRFAEKIQEFGQFTYVDDPSQFGGDGIRVTNDWATQNIVSVPIPQLNGKTFGGHVISNGSINFHRQGADRLRNLWAAWENAGLLDRILSFEGGYAARYIRRTQQRSPRPLSNHAWGTAFDINASFNPFGAQPAVVGQRGCVRELVAIANQNGFFWGGHFTTKDGMHFETGHAV